MGDIDHTWWFLTRATGLVAYLMLFASVTLGLLLTGDLMLRWLQRYRIYDLHRFLALSTLGLTLVHMFIVLPDRYLRFSVFELLVPFASPYRPTYMALGAFAFYVMVVVIGAFYLRPRVSYRAWRLIHYATFAVFTLALIHGAGAGSDAGSDWSRALYAVTGLMVFNLTVHRILKGSARGVPQRPAASAPVPASEPS
ncbi:MAG TPA: ferric reductase-like transmembrane domain-containing protein [Dehalococcoidia bacterium]|nr:ferric reductase-like transmembrane domain-containing protein [Dehalococcoidia bacterium]